LERKNVFGKLNYVCDHLSLGNRPTIQKFEQYVIYQTVDGAGVVNHWEQLGLELLKHQNALDIIKENYHNVESRCKKVFSEWLSISPAATWNDLIQALNNIKLYAAANELRKSLIKGECICTKTHIRVSLRGDGGSICPPP